MSTEEQTSHKLTDSDIKWKIHFALKKIWLSNISAFPPQSGLLKLYLWTEENIDCSSYLMKVCPVLAEYNVKINWVLIKFVACQKRGKSILILKTWIKRNTFLHKNTID